jgi:hypothetical protein
MCRKLIGVILFTCTIALSGCNRSDDQRLSQVYASGNTESTPGNATILDVTGQAMLPGDQTADERVRAVAILDALRKLVLGSRSDTLRTAGSDTIIATTEFDGISILGVTFRRHGVVMLDSVVVQIVNYRDSRQEVRRWKSFNMELIEPATDQTVNLDDLTGSLLARKIEVSGGHPVSTGLWEEKLEVRRWKKS